MNILIDTYYLLWSFIDTSKIRSILLQALLSEDNDVYYSQASLWEISIKYNLGKLIINGMSPEELYHEIENSYLRCKELTNYELITFHNLPVEHRDPFDRIIIWQCIKSDFYLLSSDSERTKYEKYGLKILS